MSLVQCGQLKHVICPAANENLTFRGLYLHMTSSSPRHFDELQKTKEQTFSCCVRQGVNNPPRCCCLASGGLVIALQPSWKPEERPDEFVHVRQSGFYLRRCGPHTSSERRHAGELIVSPHKDKLTLTGSFPVLPVYMNVRPKPLSDTGSVTSSFNYWQLLELSLVEFSFFCRSSVTEHHRPHRPSKLAAG